MADTVKAVVLFTRYRWSDPDGGQEHEASYGEEVEVSEAEFERGSSMTPPGLAKSGSKEAKAAKGGDYFKPAPAADEQTEPLTTPEGEPVNP